MDHKKRILMIAATPFFSDRGCHIRIYNEIKYLEKEGVDVTLCTYHLGYNPAGIKSENIKRIINIPWYKKITPGASWHKLYLDFLLMLLVIKEYFKLKPKVVHAHLYEGLCIAWVIKILSLGRAKVLFDCQGSLAEEMKNYTLRKKKYLAVFYYLFFGIERLLLLMPDQILCSSQNSYQFLLEKFKIKKDRIDILNDGIDDEIFYSITEEEKIELRKKLRIPEDNIVVVYSGSMTKAKGVDVLLEALPEILQKKNNVTFLFAGYGDLEPVYRERYTQYIQQGKVVIVGRFSYFDLPKYLMIADYAIDTKKDSSESSGKIFNYLIAGLQVICFRSDFNTHILGDAGLYIKDIEDLKDFTFRQKQTIAYEEGYLNWGDLIKGLLFIYKGFGRSKDLKKIGIDCRCLSIRGGVRNYAIELIHELIKQDSHNEYYLFYNDKKNLGTFKVHNIHEVAFNFNYASLYFVWDQIIVAYFCYKYQLDIIHGLKNSVPVLTRSRRIVTVHDLIPVLFPETMKRLHALYWKMVFFLDSKIKTDIVCISNATKRDFLRLYATKNNVGVIHLGIPGEMKIEQRLNTKAENAFLYLGALEPRKNLPRMIEAFNLFLKHHSGYVLYLAGKSGWEDPGIEPMLRKYGLEDKVLKLGFISDEERQSLYRKCKGFVYVSLYEGFGLPVLEAMREGLPVVTSSTSSLKEIGEGTALLVDPLNIEEIAKAMSDIAENSELELSLRQRGVEHAKEYSWQKCASETLKLYEC